MFEPRIKRLQNELKKEKIGAFLVSSAPNIFYLTGVDYFTPEERYAYMFITSKSVCLFTDGRYIEAIKNLVPKKVKVFLRSELFEIIGKSNAKKIGFENNLTFSEHKEFRRETKINYYLTDWLTEKLRAIKDENEIKNIRLACKLTDKTYSHILKNLRLRNITEKEIAWRIEQFIKENGAELAFDTIVAFGENAAIPHHKTSNKKLTKKDEFILLDFAAKVNNYCSDMTRTLLTKNASNRAKKIYETVLKSQEKVIDAIKKGERKANKLGDIANDYIVSNGFEQIPHGLGHGFGIEIHEKPYLSPSSKDVLVENQVFTIEPGIYIPGFGGVRIEDDFLLEKQGIELLTKSPKKLIAPI